MKVLIHSVLAWIIAIQSVWLFSGCTSTREYFECKCNCEDSILECSSNERQLRIKEL